MCYDVPSLSWFSSLLLRWNTSLTSLTIKGCWPKQYNATAVYTCVNTRVPSLPILNSFQWYQSPWCLLYTASNQSQKHTTILSNKRISNGHKSFNTVIYVFLIHGNHLKLATSHHGIQMSLKTHSLNPFRRKQMMKKNLISRLARRSTKPPSQLILHPFA